MSSLETILFLVVLFLANSIEAVTGFAGTLLAMPPSILLIGVDEAKVILNLMNLILSPMLVIQGWRYLDWRGLRCILWWMFVGIAVGMGVYAWVPVAILLPLYGIFIIIVGINGLRGKPQSGQLSRWRQWGTLLGAGIMHGLFVSGGPLVVVYGMMRFPDKEAFRVNISAVWIVLGLFLAGKDYLTGLITPDILWLTALSVIPLVAAVFVGNWIHRRISQAVFLKISYVLLLLAGASLIL